MTIHDAGDKNSRGQRPPIAFGKLAVQCALAALLAALGLADKSNAQSLSADFSSFYGANGAQYLNVVTDQPPDNDVCPYTLVSGNGASTSVGYFSMPYAFVNPIVAGLQVQFTPNGIDGSFSGNFVSTYQDGCAPWDYYSISVGFSGDSMIPVATTSPKYQVLSLLYIAPGDKSSSGFSQAQSAGSTASYSDNFARGTTLTFTGGILGHSNSVTFSKSQSQGHTSSYQTNYQATSSAQLPSAQQKMDHTQDQVYLEIDPTVSVTQNGDASGYFQIGPSVDATGSFTNGTPADIINANIAGLYTPSLISLGALETQVLYPGTTLPGLKFICANPLPDSQCTHANACGCVAADFAAIPPQDELANVTNDSEQPSAIDPARYVFITSAVLEGATSNSYGLTDANINGYSTSNGTSYGVSYSHAWQIPSNFTLGFSVTSGSSLSLMPFRSLRHLNASKRGHRFSKGLNALLCPAAPALLVLLLTSFAQAQQDSAALLGAACGPDGARFDVQRREAARMTPTPQPSRSRVVVYAESLAPLVGCGLVRIGLDGHWTGAACLGTWVETDLDPGVHHLCADFHWKPAGRHAALQRFMAEAGKTYYFRAEVIDSYGLNEAIHLEPLDEDEGRYLMATEKKTESTEK